MTTAPAPRPDLAGLGTYSSARPGPVPVLVRASSNEAPGPAPEELVARASDALRDAGRYPVLGGRDLAEAVAGHHGVDPDRVAVADGALALLDRLLLGYVSPGDPVVMAWRSYEAYPLSTQVAGGRCVPVPLDATGTHDLDALLAATLAERARVLVVCNPNNPTGTAVPWFGPCRLSDLLDAVPADTVVVLDQAYVEYADPDPAAPGLAALSDRDNVVVLRTFSKAHGMAGLRAGYAVGARTLVDVLRAVSPPFPVSTPAVAAALCSLEHPEWVAERVATARTERVLLRELLAAHGLPSLPSQTNFVWLPLGAAATDFAERCAAHGVLVRPFAGEGVRITVGDPRLRPALAPVLASWAADR